jgi:hypothetical protein
LEEEVSMKSQTAPVPSSRYDDFLSAVICEEPNGTQLSVISALTRIDIDPWEEAMRLEAMTEPIARQRLIAILDQALGNGHGHQQKEAIASRLVGHLPSRGAEGQSTTAIAAEVNARMLTFLAIWWSFVLVTSVASIKDKTDSVSATHSSATLLAKDTSLNEAARKSAR